jgi:hypothetical protein
LKNDIATLSMLMRQIMLAARMISGAFAIFLVFVLRRPAAAEPFEVRGYRQGMSLARVEEIARGSGHTVKENGSQPVRVTILQGNKPLVDLSFCNNRVFSAYWTVDGGLDRFVKQLDELTKQGLKKVDVTWSSMFGYDNQEHFDLTVYFTRPASERDYSVHATLFAAEQHGTTNSQVTYTASAKYCPGEQERGSPK